ncbi:conserved hypothetical protein [Leishmania major strain Friedlin]|uniref:Uncharacterized protein n=1 Tax=Leishmania major TaxID=5664 RepID=Q4Q3N5_LEIMA|nr:conserved hypothetical protein [Leishmania major strain Friedlin]CAG9580999.1 hypothetical_protein_-_conserved [Leishmania major strain Friedlin]CAJ06841.1 conserved hypothetical protein [Leishmania major strain Friedlin]|eukprot:XP_001686063.1 conserved hypothetical protein [Leishmania major strain Friedlin]
MHDAGHNSMYGAGGMYAHPDARGMMDDINEIIVTKLFSSRRDLDRLASAQDFSRRFDSNWGSYRFAGADSYGGSLCRANSAAGGSLMNLSGKPGASSITGCGTGAAGVDPDGNDGRSVHEKMPASEEREAATKEAADERVDASRNVRRSGLADTDASKPSGKSTPSTVKPSSSGAQSGETHDAPTQSSTEASGKTNKSKDVSGGAPDKGPKTSTQQSTEPKPTPAGANDRGMAALQSVKGGAGKASKTMNAQETKSRTTESIDDIPLLADDVRPKPKPAAPNAPTPQTSAVTKPPASKPSEPPNEATETAHAVDSSSTTNATRGSTANGEGRPARPRSRQATRPVSRLTSMSVVEFPVAEEVNDEMVDGGLHDPEKEAALRAEQRRERENAARAARDERQRQQQLIEEAQKQREEEAQRRRQKKEDEARQRKEMLTKMDEERKRERDAALAARERQREEEKRRFEDMKRLEEAKEAARAAALIAERQRKLEAEKAEAEEKTARSVSRQRSRRPTSRPASRLRGAIPEQPPDVTAGQIKDTLADEALGKSEHPDNESHHSHAAQALRAAQADRKTEPRAEGRHTSKSPADVRCASSTPAEVREERAARSQRSQSPLPQQKQPASAEGVMSGPPSHSAARPPPNSNPTPQSKVLNNSCRSQPKEDKSVSSAGKSSASRPANMVKTLVLVEELRDSNHALAMTGNSISYKGQTIEVTEVKTRPEDNFNYHSSVVHDVSEAVCSGYNAAVLAVDAPNTASRFDSPVWSILNRIVRTLLQENSNQAGQLRSDFQLTCAMGYLYKDKVKDLLTSAEPESPFTKIGVNPSPIYGPRLTNLTYDAVTDPGAFEDVLTTTLSRASEDAAIQNLTEGVIAAFLLIMQTRETDGKPDIYLSSLVVTTAGDDTFPYQSAISHTRNEYATVFHLVLGGPSCTCFMLNIADDDNVCKAGETEESVQERIERVLGLLQKMSALPNYDLRSGSVKRFIKYVELSHKNAQARLEKEEDDVQRRKVERYLREQERLLQDAYRLLQEWNINCGGEL